MSVIVYTESVEGAFKKAAFEAVSYASHIATKLSLPCIAVSIGKVDTSKLEELSQYGADKIINIDTNEVFNAESFATSIVAVANNHQAKVVVVSNTYSGKSVTPRITAALKASVASGVISYPEINNGFVVRKSVFSGKAFANVNLTGAIKVLAITPNSFSLAANAKAPAIEAGEFVVANNATKSVEISRASGKIPLTEAELVVSAGRGLKGPENWNLVEDLANSLGAATACSKPVSDMHWRPHSEHVGQTGITIKPNLYIAAGISGAIQHLAGVSSSKVIVAINKDPEAPFFKAADYGIVGDAFEVLPKLTEAVKKLKSQTA